MFNCNSAICFGSNLIKPITVALQAILLLSSEQDYKPSEKFQTEIFKILGPQLSTNKELADHLKKYAQKPIFDMLFDIKALVDKQEMQCDSLFNEINQVKVHHMACM